MGGTESRVTAPLYAPTSTYTPAYTPTPTYNPAPTYTPAPITTYSAPNIIINAVRDTTPKAAPPPVLVAPPVTLPKVYGDVSNLRAGQVTPAQMNELARRAGVTTEKMQGVSNLPEYCFNTLLLILFIIIVATAIVVGIKITRSHMRDSIAQV